MGSRYPICEGAIFSGKEHARACLTALSWAVQNGWIDRDALWVVGSGGLKEHALDGVQVTYAKEQFLGEDMAGHAWRYSAVSPAKTAELIEMPFELWTRMGPRMHALHGGAHWCNLVNTIDPSMLEWAEWSRDDAALCQLTLTTCFSSVRCPRITWMQYYSRQLFSKSAEIWT